MKLPLVGGSYNDPIRDINHQRCINLYPVIGGESPRASALIRTPGLKSLGTPGDGEVRGMINFGGTVYAVIGNTFYTVAITYLRH